MGGLYAGRWFGVAAFAFSVALFVLAMLVEVVATLRERRAPGTRPGGGSVKRSASTTARARGTRTPGTATTAASSSSSLRGLRLEEEDARILFLPASSFTAPSSFGGGTADRGASGAQPEPAA